MRGTPSHWCWRDEAGVWHANERGSKALTSARGFAEAAHRHGPAHLSGIRADESSGRKRRMEVWGLSSPQTCAPLGHWTGADVFAYLHAHELPVHPAYAMSFGGMLDRDRIRVASLGGERGTGHGRAEWEHHYYGWRLGAGLNGPLTRAKQTTRQGT